MSENSLLNIKKVKEINKPEFTYYIPSYQRGYKWETKQVLELLEDITEIINKDIKNYCLQPVVVKEVKGKINTWEIIDGQQRLTTIFILLQRLKRFSSGLFKIDYETRKYCVDFFEGLEFGKLDNTNSDFAHISNAYTIIDKWIKDELVKNSNYELQLYLKITEVLEVIWYEIDKDETDSIKIFTRLNVGKIPLTNAELIKAIFLSEDNLLAKKPSEMKYTNKIYDKQLEVANEWNQIEYSLNNLSFWHFINRTENNTPTRIDFIFNLMVEIKEIEIKDQYDSFRYYYKLLQSRKTEANDNESFLLKNEWDEIKHCYGTLNEWYNDKDLYHLIGYLIWAGTEIKTLYNDYKDSTKKKFKESLRKKIGDTVASINLNNLTYQKGSELMKVLVLFNVISTNMTLNNSTRFPFENLKLKDNCWSFEHIHAQNSEEINQKDYINWLIDHKKILNNVLNENQENDELIKEIDILIENIENKNNDNITDSFNEISQKIILQLSANEKSKTFKNEELKNMYTNTHHLCNMALLDSKSNSGLSNSVFAVKREKILDKEQKGAFIPIGTRNVFLKYYSDNPDHLIYWTIEDRENYFNKLSGIINSFITK